MPVVGITLSQTRGIIIVLSGKFDVNTDPVQLRSLFSVILYNSIINIPDTVIEEMTWQFYDIIETAVRQFSNNGITADNIRIINFGITPLPPTNTATNIPPKNTLYVTIRRIRYRLGDGAITLWGLILLYHQQDNNYTVNLLLSNRSIDNRMVGLYILDYFRNNYPTETTRYSLITDSMLVAINFKSLSFKFESLGVSSNRIIPFSRFYRIKLHRKINNEIFQICNTMTTHVFDRPIRRITMKKVETGYQVDSVNYIDKPVRKEDE